MKMNWLNSKPKFLFVIALLSFVSITAGLVVFVPSNMDEFLQYHRIACTAFPNALEHIFREGCTEHPTRFLGFDFYRSYSYAGYSSNLLYWPFYYVYPAPASHHLLGVLILMIFSFLLVKAFTLAKETVVIPLIYFPILFQMIHDSGPIRLAVLSFPIVALLASQLVAENTSLPRRGLSFVILFIVVSIAIENKPFYVYLLPQVLLLALGFAVSSHHYGTIKFRVTKNRVFSNLSTQFTFGLCLILSAVFLACLLILIFMQVPIGGGKYSTYLARLMHEAAPSIDLLHEIEYTVRFLLAPLTFISRIYHSPRFVISALAFLPVLYLCFLALKHEDSKLQLTIVGSMGLSIAIFIFTRQTWSGHHFVFLHIPLLILLMRFASGGTRRYTYVVLSVLLSAIVSCFQMYLGKELPATESTRQPIFNYLSRDEVASNAIINFVSWGGYYQQSLYGSRAQLVTYIEPLTDKSVAELTELWTRSGRKEIINVCLGCDARTVSAFFPDFNVSTLYFPNTSWRLVKIER